LAACSSRSSMSEWRKLKLRAVTFESSSFYHSFKR
jgi:hypothetical protein